jgi:hypothetical protein
MVPEQTMDRIPAGSNLSIDIQQNQWRLLTNGDGAETVLVEAKPGQPLRYVSTFGKQRRLPISGALSLEDVDRVVLGWSNRNEAWHLGLMLKPELSETRGSRWCGLVYWPDADTSRYRDIASRAGEALAQQLNVPFTFIPPTSAGAAAPTMAPAVPAAPPVQLPLKLDQWTLQRTSPTALELTLSPAWGRARLLRALWYILWAGVFMILSVTTLTSGIALPQPEFLPYAGLVGALFLVLLSLGTIIGVIRRTKRIEINGATRTVSSGRWSYSASQLKSIYATHIVSKVNRRKRSQQVHYGEINLFGVDGAFHLLAAQGQTDDKLPTAEDQPLELSNAEQIVPLTAQNAHTRLQAAALLIAQTLQLPAWFDQRVK